MSSSFFRSIITTVTGHSIDTCEDVIYYPSSLTWDRYHKHEHTAATSVGSTEQHNTDRHDVRGSSRQKKSRVEAENTCLVGGATASSSDIPKKVLVGWDKVPPKQLPAGVDPTKFRIVRVVVISDTHEYHEKMRIPTGDLLLHCGDSLQVDRLTIHESLSRSKLKSFLRWFGAQPCRHKILIGGNHDLIMSKMVLSELRSLVATEANGAIYLEDEVFQFRRDLLSQKPIETGGQSTMSATRDCCAGLTIFGSPRSYANTKSSPNVAFQERLLWHHSAYHLSYRELAAYRPLPSVLRSLLNPVSVVLRDGTVFTTGGHHNGHHNAHADYEADDANQFPPHTYFIAGKHCREGKDGDEGCPSCDRALQQLSSSASSAPLPSSNESCRFPTKGPLRLVNGPPSIVAHVRLVMQKDLQSILTRRGPHEGESSSSSSSASPATPRQTASCPQQSTARNGRNREQIVADTTTTTLFDELREMCVGSSLTRAQKDAITYVRCSRAISAEGCAVYATRAGEVYSAEGYLSKSRGTEKERRIAEGHGIPHYQMKLTRDSNRLKAAGEVRKEGSEHVDQNQTTTATTLSSGKSGAGVGGILPSVQPLPRVDIAMTHQSRTNHLRDFVAYHLQPRLMHCGGHLHEAKGIHTEYTFDVSGDSHHPESRHLAGKQSHRIRRIPSVGGAMTQGHFGKEWLQPATVIDVVVPWEEEGKEVS